MNDSKNALKERVVQEELKTKKMTKAAIQRMGRLALDAGLGQVKISDKELTAGFKDIAARFQ